MDFVTVENLWVAYGNTVAVKNLSFGIPQGEVFGFIGPNGAGKSSTMRVLATLMEPTHGRALINNVDVTDNPHEVRRKIGYVPDFFGVYDDLTVNEYLHFFAAAYRLDTSTRQKTVDDVLELTDLLGKKGSQVDSLSRGMKQRLGLARVLLHDPDVLLLDEPASGLDPRARIEMRELLKALKEMGNTILISSHILSELDDFCTRIGIIEQGELVAEGSLVDIYRQLSVQRTIIAEISNLDDAMMAKLEQIKGVTNIDRDGGHRVSLSLYESDLVLEDLHAELVALGARLRLFKPEDMNMESAFMKLTKGKTQ